MVLLLGMDFLNPSYKPGTDSVTRQGEAKAPEMWNLFLDGLSAFRSAGTRQGEFTQTALCLGEQEPRRLSYFDHCEEKGLPMRVLDWQTPLSPNEDRTETAFDTFEPWICNSQKYQKTFGTTHHSQISHPDLSSFTDRLNHGFRKKYVRYVGYKTFKETPDGNDEGDIFQVFQVLDQPRVYYGRDVDECEIIRSQGWNI